MMTTPTNIQQILDYVEQCIVPMYAVKRDMTPPKLDWQENDAEHSWAAAFLAASLAPLIDPSLDIGKISQLAIVHDLPEIYAGDVSAMDMAAYSAPTKQQREQDAIMKLHQNAGPFVWATEMLDIYERKDTNEAMFVYAVDKIITVIYDYLDEGAYLHKMHYTLPMYDEVLSLHRDKAQAYPKIGEYYDEARALLHEHPEFFPES